jgi:GDP-4-dehydro-6-deoxy-D-mannose reductase
LITGVTGFAGSHLAEALLNRGDVVLHGTSRRPEWPAELVHLATRVTLHPCDLAAGGQALLDLLREARPDCIYHLAGYAAVGRSFREPDAAWDGNLLATRRLYEAVASWGGKPRIVYVGSGLIYGDAIPDRPQDEDTPLLPASPYAASKAAADLLSYQATRDPGLDIVRVRPFNHIGPRQSPQFALAHFAQQLAAIECGLQPGVLETGDLSPCRDLTDVRDTVQAYVLLMARGRRGGAYNVASGWNWSMRDVLDALLRLSTAKVEMRQRADLVRPTEQHVAQADAGRLRRETGWQPHYGFEQTIADTLEYWRRRTRDERALGSRYAG